MARKLWKDLEPLLQGFLKDEPLSSDRSAPPVRYDGKILRAWWNLSQHRLTSLVPQVRHVIYTDLVFPLELPALFYQPRVFQVAKTPPLGRLTIEQAFLDRAPGYYVQEQRLYVANLECQGEQAVLVYDSYLPEVDSDEAVVKTPAWAIEACCLYVAMEAATREAMADARYRKFAQPTDIPGNPTHNPFVHVAEFLEQRFNAIIATHSTDTQVMYEE